MKLNCVAWQPDISIATATKSPWQRYQQYTTMVRHQGNIDAITMTTLDCKIKLHHHDNNSVMEMKQFVTMTTVVQLAP